MIGKTISHYKILDELGKGGMGVVYRAEDTRLKRIVALKFLPPELTRDAQAKKRFVHEAQAASALDHPNICTIHEIDETDDGRMFICMACYEGETLREKISERPLEIDAAITTAMRVAEGLERAHEQGIVHRDLKPANIFVTDDGQVKIVDFGLAKLTGKTKLTKTGMVTGTVAYMSPEQAKGQEVDRRTDIWSLGVALYEMITGQVPFKSDYDEAVVYSILNEPAEAVTGLRSGVPLELERIVTKCLEKDAAERYQTAGDLLADLRHLQRTISAHAETPQLGVGPRKRKRSVRLWSWVIGTVIVIAAAIVVVSRYRSTPPLPLDSTKKMLVVLPFENLGSAEDDYFAAGMTEEITTRLAAVRDLGVISRKSAVHYAETDKTVEQIGDELGVDYILEGTVRWARDVQGANRVRITPELIRVSDDVRLWSEPYDRIMQDIFEIQTDIAERVVEKLGLTILTESRRAVDTTPTENLEAYQAYLRGGYYTRQPHFTAENWRRAAQNYGRAVELDPGFALAYARLSEAHARLYYFRADLTEERREMARSAVDRAVDLAPDLPEVRLALGYYYLMVERDVKRGFREFAVAERKLPESAEVLEAKGDGYRQEGKWLEAFDHYERASRLSPRNVSPIVEFAITGWLYRRYPEAVEAADKAIAIAPNQNWPYLTKGLTYWSWHGVSDEARKLFEAVPADHDWSPWVWYWQNIYEGKYREAIDHLSSVPGDWIRIKICARPKVLYEAYAHEALDEPELASAAYETARILLEAEVEAYPEDPRYHSSLGIAYAALGRVEDAVGEGKRAVGLLPISKDAVYGLPYMTDLAHIYTLLGDFENALAKIEELLTIPSNISVPLLEVDPRWDRIREHPGFKQLVRKYSRPTT